MSVPLYDATMKWHFVNGRNSSSRDICRNDSMFTVLLTERMFKVLLHLKYVYGFAELNRFFSTMNT